MIKTICINCIHWKMDDAFLKVGECQLFHKRTEWNAGINWQTKKRISICEGFK